VDQKSFRLMTHVLRVACCVFRNNGRNTQHEAGAQATIYLDIYTSQRRVLFYATQ